MRLRRNSNEVAIAEDKIVRIKQADLAELDRFLPMSVKRRSRICAHRDPSDSLHEMIIALARGSSIRPHKHLHKSESFHIIEGEVDVGFFNASGTVADVLPMGEVHSG